jgi:methionine sulfoxide reductase heme-binding subunit
VGNGGTVAYRSYGGGKQLNTIWQSVTWDIARAGGFTAYILLTLAVIVGLALSTQIQSPRRWPRLINSELHNFLTLLSTIFLVVHILAVWIDPFTHFGLNEILIPLASSYRPVWMALGIVGLYLGIAIGISTWLRPHIGYKLWRSLHVLTLGIFALATIHGIGTGSDTQTSWALGIYLVSSILVGSLLCRRLFLSRWKNKSTRAHTITPTRSAMAVPQGNPRTLDRARITGTSINEQKRADVTRVK